MKLQEVTDGVRPGGRSHFQFKVLSLFKYFNLIIITRRVT